MCVWCVWWVGGGVEGGGGGLKVVGGHLALFYFHVELSARTHTENTHMHTPIKGSLLYLTLIDKNTRKQTPHLIISIKVRLSRLLTVCVVTLNVSE